MNIEIINTGSELMLGRVLNTHQQWLCHKLSDCGYEVSRQVAVPDSGLAIQQVVREALSRADLILVTGGLGPTSDDLTRPMIAELAGRPLKLDPSVMASIEHFYRDRNRPFLESTQVQALTPEGCLVLPNHHGTAPGLVMDFAPNPFRADAQASLLIMLPGPPRELYPMFEMQVLPLVQTRFPLTSAYCCRNLKLTGLGESSVEEKIAHPLKHLVDQELIIGYCARVGEVEIRLEAQGQRADSLVAEAEAIVRKLLEPFIFATGTETLEEVVIRLLAGQRHTMAVAESCTGGLVAHRLTNVPGASAVVMAGLVTYSNEAKQRLLGVPADLIRTQGAVSEDTARAMAEGARQRNQVDYALGITGIAGPTGGTPDKPVGTVFIALASPQTVQVQHQINRFERESFKQATAQQALEMLRRAVLGI